jgi:hypothetical protein
MSVHGGLVISADDGPKRTVRVQLAQQVLCCGNPPGWLGSDFALVAPAGVGQR